jgi:hypothetical protein
MDPQTYEPSLEFVREAAWDLVTRLVEEADFTQGGEAFVQYSNLDVLKQPHGYELLVAVTDGFHSFVVHEELSKNEGVFTPFFSLIRYQGPIEGLLVCFNPFAQLQLLQQGIVLLRQQGRLTVDELKNTMRQLAPHLDYQMSAQPKKKRRSIR